MSKSVKVFLVLLVLAVLLSAAALGLLLWLGWREGRVPSRTLLEIDFSSPIAEVVAEDPFSDLLEQDRMKLRHVVQALHAAAEDDHVVGLVADLSHVGTLDVRPAPAADLTGAGVTTYRVSPRRALVLYPQSARKAVGEQLAPDALVIDATAAYTVLAITGPQARALIARLTHLHHFPSGGEIAHVTGHVLPAGAGYRIVVAQEYGHYVAEVALDCAAALGGGLVGVDALPGEEAP